MKCVNVLSSCNKPVLEAKIWIALILYMHYFNFFHMYHSEYEIKDIIIIIIILAVTQHRKGYVIAASHHNRIYRRVFMETHFIVPSQINKVGET